MSCMPPHVARADWVILALLALSPAEFDDYYHSPLGDLLERIPARAGASCP